MELSLCAHISTSKLHIRRGDQRSNGGARKACELWAALRRSKSYIASGPCKKWMRTGTSTRLFHFSRRFSLSMTMDRCRWDSPIGHSLWKIELKLGACAGEGWMDAWGPKTGCLLQLETKTSSNGRRESPAILQSAILV
jgi:hypothetical protein